MWTDLDSDGFPDVKETVVYTIAVKNAGTVTLEEVEVVSTSGTVSCLDDQPVALLAAGDSYECATSHKVWAALALILHSSCLSQKHEGASGVILSLLHFFSNPIFVVRRDLFATDESTTIPL